MEILEDVWVPTQCSRCYSQCGIRVRRVNGVAIKIEGMPETQMGGEGGLWAKGMPIARGKGTNFDNLMEIDLKHTDPVSGNMELTVKVKVSKV